MPAARVGLFLGKLFGQTGLHAGGAGVGPGLDERSPGEAVLGRLDGLFELWQPLFTRDEHLVYVFAEVAVGLGAVNAEAAEHVDANLFGLGVNGVAFERGQEAFAIDDAVFVSDIHMLGLVVDAGADDVHLVLGLGTEDIDDLLVTTLHSMTHGKGSERGR